MLEEIIEIAKEYVEDEDIEVTGETSLLEDLEFSSMEFFSFISDIEDKFDTTIPENALKKIETINDIVEFLSK
ncbi:MAG: acyl carrier protein [Lachnospiraceae bacterium]|nr:acyl carrier protein [Lachnospiraceae bacterium]